jgi:HK97 family phage major capsid protein
MPKRSAERFSATLDLSNIERRESEIRQVKLSATLAAASGNGCVFAVLRDAASESEIRLQEASRAGNQVPTRSELKRNAKGRKMSSEIIKSIDRFGAEVVSMREAHTQRLDALQERLEEVEGKSERPRGAKSSGSAEEKHHREPFNKWLRNPLSESTKAALAQAESDYEKKDVSIGTGSAGGYALPKEISREIEARVRQLNPFRGLVSVRQASSSDFHVLVSMGDGAAGWVSETGTRSATNSPTLRDVAPTHGETYALPTATEWSLQDVFSTSEWLTTEAGDEFSSLEATSIVSGNGSTRPTGLLNTAPTAADDDASDAGGRCVGVHPERRRLDAYVRWAD